MKDTNSLKNYFDLLECICGECCTCDGNPPTCGGDPNKNSRIGIINNSEKLNKIYLRSSVPSSYIRADVPLA